MKVSESSIQEHQDKMNKSKFAITMVFSGRTKKRLLKIKERAGESMSLQIRKAVAEYLDKEGV